MRVRCINNTLLLLFIQINKRDVDDFSDSKSSIVPYIPVLIYATSKATEYIRHLITIEGIVTVARNPVGTSSKPQIVIFRSLANDTQSKCLPTNMFIVSIILHMVICHIKN